MFAFLVGLILSGGWLYACYYFIVTYYGWEQVLFLAPFAQVFLVIGASSPLAVIWSLVAFFSLSLRLRNLERLTAELGSLALKEISQRELVERIELVTAPPNDASTEVDIRV